MIKTENLILEALIRVNDIIDKFDGNEMQWWIDYLFNVKKQLLDTIIIMQETEDESV